MKSFNEALRSLSACIANLPSEPPVLSTTGCFALPPYVKLQSIPLFKIPGYLKQIPQNITRDTIHNDTWDELDEIVHDFAYSHGDTGKSYNTYLVLRNLLEDTEALDATSLPLRLKAALYRRPNFCVEYVANFQNDRHRTLAILSSGVYVDDARDDDAILRSEVLTILYSVKEALYTFTYNEQLLDPQRIFVGMLH